MPRLLVDIVFGLACAALSGAERARAMRPTPPYRRPVFGREVNDEGPLRGSPMIQRAGLGSATMAQALTSLRKESKA